MFSTGIETIQRKPTTLNIHHLPYKPPTPDLQFDRTAALPNAIAQLTCVMSTICPIGQLNGQ